MNPGYPVTEPKETEWLGEHEMDLEYPESNLEDTEWLREHEMDPGYPATEPKTNAIEYISNTLSFFHFKFFGKRNRDVDMA